MHFSKLFFSALTFLAVASAAPAELAGTEVAKSSDVGIVKYTNMNTSPAHSELTARVEDVADNIAIITIITFTGAIITRGVPVRCYYTVTEFLAIFSLDTIISCKTIEVNSSGSITYFGYFDCLGDPQANWNPEFPPTTSCRVSK